MKKINIKLKLSFSLIMLLVSSLAFAATPITFETEAPLQAVAGEPFRVGFTLNTQSDNPNSFKAPSFDGFEVLAGPNMATSSSTQIINNQITSRVNITFTYVILAQEGGIYTISSASIENEGKLYTSKPQPIEVISAEQSQTSTGQSSNQNSNQNHERKPQISKDDIFMRTVVSRTSLYKGEPLRATVKLYSQVNIAGAEDEKKPSFNGFWSQDLSNNNSQTYRTREKYNGRVYDVINLYDYLLYPQQSGTITIEPAELTVIAQIRVRNNNREHFFDDGYDIINTRRPLTTAPVNIEVKPLPAGAPASFNGAVGNFTLESSIDSLNVAANSSLSYSLRISGNGNLSLIQAPDIKIPSSFEQYNTKATESINTTPNGARGYKKFEYPLIPRGEGDFRINPTKFSFFNPKSEKYEVLKSESYDITVTPDSSSVGQARLIQGAPSKFDVTMLDKDIRFIKLDDSNLSKRAVPLLFSRLYFYILASIAVLFAALYFIISKHLKNSQNTLLTRGKRANKVAIQRLKLSNKYISLGDEKHFYREVLTALWGYMSDKFNIPVANLSKENVREELAKRHIDAEHIQSFSDIVTLCEEAQYSPMASAQMKEVYNKSLKLISKIETEIKGTSNNFIKR